MERGNNRYGGVKNQPTLKGASFEEAQANMQAKLSESGKTQEEIDALMEKLSTKFDELKVENGIEVAAKQAEREANIAARVEKGVTSA